MSRPTRRKWNTLTLIYSSLTPDTTLHLISCRERKIQDMFVGKRGNITGSGIPGRLLHTITYLLAIDGQILECNTYDVPIFITLNENWRISVSTIVA